MRKKLTFLVNEKVERMGWKYYILTLGVLILFTLAFPVFFLLRHHLGADAFGKATIVSGMETTLLGLLRAMTTCNSLPGVICVMLNGVAQKRSSAT